MKRTWLKPSGMLPMLFIGVILFSYGSAASATSIVALMTEFKYNERFQSAYQRPSPDERRSYQRHNDGVGIGRFASTFARQRAAQRADVFSDPLVNDYRFGILGSSSTIDLNDDQVSITYTENGQDVQASVWGNTGAGDSFEAGLPVPTFTGLGGCNANEACVVTNEGRNFDNTGEAEWLLLEFDTEVIFETISLFSWLPTDKDLSFFVGTTDGGLDIDLTGLDYGDLPGLGFGGQNNVFNNVGSGLLDVSLGGLVGNTLLVGAYLGDGSESLADLLDDSFRIAGVSTAAVPIPPAAALFLSGLVGLGMFRRFQNR